MSTLTDSSTPFDTHQPSQVEGLDGFTVDPIITIGETINGTQGEYTPVGIPDGMGAYELDDDTVRILVNHELNSEDGYLYELENGTELSGARVSYFDIDKETFEIVDSGLAYDTIINRAGEVVDEASDLDFGGLDRYCSAQFVEAHQFGEGRGFEDDIFFTGEETFGGTEFALDVETNTLYAVPALGRAAWENITELDTGTTDHVALLVGDDREAAPLLLYVGEKGVDINEDGEIDFLESNGLADGDLYVWVPDPEAAVADSPDDPDAAPDPFGFNGTGNSLDGSFVEIEYHRTDLLIDNNGDGFSDTFLQVDIDLDGDKDAVLAAVIDEDGDGIADGADVTGDGVADYDAQGYATQEFQDFLALEAGYFQFSRPEDVATNPEDGTQAVLASTGRDSRFPEDSWGTTYLVDVDFNDIAAGDITASLDILYDGDDAGAGQFSDPDFGLRSPDNLDWSDDGYIYIQEDRSVDGFGDVSGEEASIWQLDPESGELTRIAQIDRSGVPVGQTDGDPTDLGDWESSGILDVSELFGEEPGTLFIFDVQAHSLTDGVIADENLVQGGQISFLRRSDELGTDAGDIFTGTVEDDSFSGLDSDDRIKGGKGNDILSGDVGNDNIKGQIGDDSLYGNDGNDKLVGGRGDDRIEGGSGDDVLSGGSGDDTLIGGSGNDNLQGDRGNDVLIAGEGNDNLSGGQGDDTLVGGPGNNFLLGDNGSDLFVFEQGTGLSVLGDFEVGTDQIDFSNLFADFSELSAATTQLGASLLISADVDNLVLITGTDLTDLNQANLAGDLIFA